MIQSITYVTNNEEKLFRARHVLESQGIYINPVDIECPEIQSDNLEEIVKYSAEYSIAKLNKCVVKSDMGLYIDALNGFPGPYSAYVERKLDAIHILKMLEGSTDRKAYYKEIVCFYNLYSKPVIFKSITAGTISLSVDGAYGENFDRIFIPKDSERTIANEKDEERALRYNCDGWYELADYLIANQADII